MCHTEYCIVELHLPCGQARLFVLLYVLPFQSFWMWREVLHSAFSVIGPELAISGKHNWHMNKQENGSPYKNGFGNFN